MLGGISRVLGWAVLSVAVLGPPATTAKAALLDRDEVWNTLKQVRDSLETVQFRGEEYDLDANGAPDRSHGFTRIDFALGSGGRRSVVITAVRPTGEESVFDLHEEAGGVLASCQPPASRDGRNSGAGRRNSGAGRPDALAS